MIIKIVALIIFLFFYLVIKNLNIYNNLFKIISSCVFFFWFNYFQNNIAECTGKDKVLTFIKNQSQNISEEIILNNNNDLNIPSNIPTSSDFNIFFSTMQESYNKKHDAAYTDYVGSQTLYDNVEDLKKALVIKKSENDYAQTLQSFLNKNTPIIKNEYKDLRDLVENVSTYFSKKKTSFFDNEQEKKDISLTYNLGKDYCKKLYPDLEVPPIIEKSLTLNLEKKSENLTSSLFSFKPIIEEPLDNSTSMVLICEIDHTVDVKPAHRKYLEVYLTLVNKTHDGIMCRYAEDPDHIYIIGNCSGSKKKIEGYYQIITNDTNLYINKDQHMAKIPLHVFYTYFKVTQYLNSTNFFSHLGELIKNEYRKPATNSDIIDENHG